jgi:glutamate racemase
MLGLFDSGIGGLTVVRELLRRSPEASFVYLGDTARAPYGNKSADVLRRYAIEDAAFLIAQGATAIAVACNTVSAVAMDALHEAYPKMRFFDVVAPAVEAAIAMRPKKIGVIGTRATIQSGVYERMLLAVGAPLADALGDGQARGLPLRIFTAACPLFVPLVEENWIHRSETKRIARTYLATLKQKQIDALILGCTHYPLLAPVIRATLQKRVKIVDSASALLDAISREAPELLASQTPSRQEYYFTDPSPLTERIASRWLGRTINGLKADFG